MTHADIVIKDGYIVTLDKERRVIGRGYVAVKGSTILEVGEGDPPSDMTAGRVISARDRIIFPGLIDTHMHTFQSFFKGLGRDRRLFDWADAAIRPGLYKMDPEMCYYGALVGCIESLHSGCTTILDYMYAHAVPDTDDGVLKAFEESGIRGILGRGKIRTEVYPPEFNVTLHETEQFFFDEAVRLHRAYKDHSRISVAMAPGIIFELSKDGFYEARRIADETGMLITMHTLETSDDDAFSLENYGLRTVPFLESTGVLGPDFLAVHCVAVQDEDIEILKKHNVKVSHNPHSNMTLGSGIAPVVKMKNAGLTISLACDGAGSNDAQDMLEVLKTAALLQKADLKDPSVMSAAETLEMATLGGADALGRASDLGSIEAGKKADLFIYNPFKNRSVPVYDVISSLIYCSGPANVEAAMVDGRMVMEDGVLVTLDEEKIIFEVQARAKKLAQDLDLKYTHWGKAIPPWW